MNLKWTWKEFCEPLYFISWIYDSVAETGQISNGTSPDFSGWSKKKQFKCQYNNKKRLLIKQQKWGWLMVYFWLYITENPVQTHLNNKEYLSETIKSRGRVSFLVWLYKPSFFFGSTVLSNIQVLVFSLLPWCSLLLTPIFSKVVGWHWNNILVRWKRERERYGFL